MLLRSAWTASNIAAPGSALTLEAFGRARGTPVPRHIPLPDFVAYGEWFGQQVLPGIDRRAVVRVEATASGFRVVLDDGEPIDVPRVVVAAGIKAFAWRPPQFADLAPDLASHAVAEPDLGRFAGQRVAVIGGGQSAIESAALLGESGAEVELIMRTPHIHWVGRATRDGMLGGILFDRSTDVGPAIVSHVVARPGLLRRLPASVQRRMTQRSILAGGSGWLKDRMAGVRITTGRQVTTAARADGHVRLRLDDGAERDVDHVLLATGYHVDVERYRFLAPALAARVSTVQGNPVLDQGLQSSIAGLHFLGAPAVHSFGPIFRFVCGTNYSGRAVARSLAGAGARRADRASDLSLPYATPEERAS
jgi:cation diffusion facilitator CzcD-associated flavoprotein CzcO